MVKSRSAKIGDWIIVIHLYMVYFRLSAAGVEHIGAFFKFGRCLDQE